MPLYKDKKKHLLIYMLKYTILCTIEILLVFKNKQSTKIFNFTSESIFTSKLTMTLMKCSKKSGKSKYMLVIIEL